LSRTDGNWRRGNGVDAPTGQIVLNGAAEDRDNRRYYKKKRTIGETQETAANGQHDHRQKKSLRGIDHALRQSVKRRRFQLQYRSQGAKAANHQAEENNQGGDAELARYLSESVVSLGGKHPWLPVFRSVHPSLIGKLPGADTKQWMRQGHIDRGQQKRQPRMR
jgi:hypothetical protein